MHKNRNTSGPGQQQDNDVEMTRVENEEGPDGEEHGSDKSEVVMEVMEGDEEGGGNRGNEDARDEVRDIRNRC